MPDERDALSIEATAEWAFQLSYFLLADRRDARSVLYQAIARLYVSALAQRKRQAKRPKGEVHKKLSLAPHPLLQYLIYLCAEPYEFEQEQEHRSGAGALAVEDMIVRYIKHLMLLYLEHNSFYAAVGQSSVLFNLSTSQAGRLYEILVQASSAHLETKGDYSVRDAKRELRRRLASRFERFVAVCDGTRREQLFVTMADAGAHSWLVKRCLHRLQPVQEVGDGADYWHLPSGFDPFAYDLAELQYDWRNGDPAAEPAAELRRMHVVTHPCCWSRLLRALRFNHSWRCLVLPEFILTSDDNPGRRPPDDRRTSALTPDELAGLVGMLRSEARRRKGLFASGLSLSIDGSPCGSWSVDQSRVTRIRFGAGARVLSISAQDDEGEMLLAQHLLQFAGASDSQKAGPAIITLEGGQEFIFTVTPDYSDAGEGFVVTVRFRETKLRRVTARCLVHSYRRVAGVMIFSRRLPARLKVILAFTASLLLMMLAGWWLTRTVQPNLPPPSVDAGRQPPVYVPEPGGGPQPGSGPQLSQPQGEGGDSAESGVWPGKGRNRPRPSDQAALSGKRRSAKDAVYEATVGAPPPKIVLTLRDGAKLVSLDEEGRSAGLEGIPAPWRRAVEAALLARRVKRPAALEALGWETEVLLGAPGPAGGDVIISPVGKVVESNQPLFRWRAVGGEASYTVSVFDLHFKRVAQSGLLSVTEWMPPRALRRGATYIWQVKSLRDGAVVVSPSPPAPEARFKVLEQTAADQLMSARRLRSTSHLTLGVLYARAGMMEEAEREFRALAESNPDSTVAQSLLLSVREWRHSR
jgi:hypothetical protein